LDTCLSDDCKNPHGHSYKCEVTFTGFGLNKDGMLCDFKVVKEIVDPIIKKYDHTFLTKESFGMNPTAENLAWCLWKEITSKLFEVMGGSVLLLNKIKLWETDTCFVTVQR
jgi:6-pyruvoyltetrahydropterin/6-carboxytetrahydropterin synthase